MHSLTAQQLCKALLWVTEKLFQQLLAQTRLRMAVAGPASKKPLPKILADTKVVYIGELEWWTTDADIETLCSEFGLIESVNFFEEKSSGKSKGYCLVKFTNKEAANLCRHGMNG